ncbi:hypothetical protein [Neisseria zoodegmatis]|uniref:DUF3291 domain-containing protein n=1 Tax=Neisseria zoodegmatis TaxID=326523 RepID=A0AB38DSS8_9NEIS|nr:hypothetical protein [Neisseria zoodegmatis]OSI11267.1 hypothetical protein BWD10_02445 [Neisseria zoodegmatis]SNU80428.1 Uncharacterised protein [Neisseria zoodegmatis]
MNYIYRFDDIQTIIRRKISASKWTPGRYPHKGYHQLSNKLKPNQQIFSLSFWKSENHMKENEKNHNTERNGEIKNLKLYIRVNENSNFFKKYTRINDDGFTDEILGSTA